MKDLIESPMFTLTILFIMLKLGGVITWAWWVVLSPAWGGPLVFALILVCYQLYLAYRGRRGRGG